MKLLRNQWVVGALVLVALVYVFRQVLYPPGRRAVARPGAGPVVTSAITPGGGAASAAAPAPKPPEAIGIIDRDFAGAHWSIWIKSPERDPFLQTEPAPPAEPAQSRPISQLKLNGIWRQDDVTLIAINRTIFHLGDVVGGYRIDKVDNGGVWLESHGQKQLLIFDSQVMAVSPNRGVEHHNHDIRKLPTLSHAQDTNN